MGRLREFSGPKDFNFGKGTPRYGWSDERLATDPGSVDSLDDFPTTVRCQYLGHGKGTVGARGITLPAPRPRHTEWDGIVESAVIPRYTPRLVAHVLATDEEAIEVGNRVFAITHREVYDLFREWGWEDGPERGDGHKRMLWPPTGQYVQIMPPDRAGTGESGNALAMKQAWKIMGLESLQQFLEKPIEKAEQERRRRIERADRLHKEIEKRVYQHAAVAASQQQMEEPEMARPRKDGKAPVVGIVAAVTRAMSTKPNKVLSIDEVHALVTKQPGFENVDRRTVQQNVSNASKTNKYPVISPKRGFYKYVDGPKAATITEATHYPTNVADEVVAAPAPVSLNGATPELLSRVHVLDGGKYLFQGDDGNLYVVSSIVRLDV